MVWVRCWCGTQAGAQPEPREEHVACIISKYMLISGGSTQGGSKRLGDLQVRRRAGCAATGMSRVQPGPGTARCFLTVNQIFRPALAWCSQVLDLYSPRWECLDEGVYTSSLPWLRPHSVYTCFHGNKLYTLKPSMHEKMWELQVRKSG